MRGDGTLLQSNSKIRRHGVGFDPEQESTMASSKKLVVALSDTTYAIPKRIKIPHSEVTDGDI